MSTTIDSKVVEMRFDNKQFETNVATTMSTLDKLKQKLHLDGATKGLENVDAAAKKVNMTGLGSAVETVQAKFSALQVVGVTALANITNSAVNAGKNIVKSLTIDPVKTGFSEYELKMGSIQTIMAGTGESLDTVNRYLNELNKYSDDTIYSFKDMTSNIGKFTNAGVKLEDAVLAIKGISNEAALSGANANEASRAMYNFSQALSSGFVKLIDWKSIELANMATKDFKEQLIQTAVEVGTLKKGADGMYDVANVVSKANATSLNATKNFNDSLGNQWMTTEVLIGTLRKYADETTEIGAKATAAATEVKTFTMMMDTLKEAAQSGWAQTWELLVGDFEEAKAFFTELSGIFGEILGKSADRRNNLLSGALTSNWDKLINKIGEAGIGLEEFEESIRKVTGAEKFDGIIEEFGSLDKAVKEGAISSDVLKKALDAIAGTEADSKIKSFVEGLKEIDRTLRFGNTGEDVKKLQTALKELGYELGTFGENADGIDGVIGSVTEEAIRAFQEANGLVVDGIAGPETLAALEKAGNKIGNITGDVNDLKSSCGELIDVITKDSGRELLLDSLLNVIKAIQRPLMAVGEALRNTFSITPDNLYNALEKINGFTKRFVPKGVLDAKTWANLTDKVNELGISTTEFELKIKEVLKDNGVDVDKLIGKYGSLGKAFEKGAISFDYIKKALLTFEGMSESLIEGGETVDKIRRSFEGLFAVVDIIGTVLAGPFKFAFKLVTNILERLGLTVLDVTANIGDGIVNLRDSIDGIIDAITTFLVDNVTKWIEKFRETEFFKTVAGWFQDASTAIRGALDDISNRVENFNASGFGKRLKAFAEVFSAVINKLRNSKVVVAIFDGITSAFGKLKEFFSKFKLPKLNLDNLTTFFQNFVKIGEKIGGTGKNGALGAVTGFGQHLKDNVLSWNWTVFKETALEKFVQFWLKTGDLVKKAFDKAKEAALAIKKFLFGTEEVNLPVIMDAVTKFLWIITLIKTIQMLDTIVSPFDNISNALNNFASSLKWDAIAGAFKSLAIALGVLTLCIVVLTQMPDMKKAWSAAGILITLIIVLAGVITAMGLVAGKAKNGLNLAGVTLSLLMLVGSIALLIHALKEIDGLTLKDPSKTVFTLIGILVGLTIAVRAISKAGGASFRSVAAILTLVGALKMILDVITAYDEFDWTGKSRAIGKMVEMMLALSVAIRIMSGGVKAGASASGIALSIIAMVIALKVMLNSIDDIASKSPEDLKKGITVIGILMGIMTAMMTIVNLTSKGTVLEKGQKSVNNFTGLAMALIAVVAAIWLLGKMDINTLTQGGLAVAGVLILFTGMLAVLGKSCSGLKIGTILSLLLMISVVIAEVAVIMYLMKDVPWQNSLSAAAGLAAVLLAMSFAMRSLTKYDVSSGNIFKWVGAMALLALIVGLLGSVLYQMRGINPATSLANAAGLAIVLGTMALSLWTLSKYEVSSGNIYKWIGALAVLSVIIGLLGAILWGMSALGVKDSIANATALSELLIVLTGVLFVLTKFNVTGNITPAIVAIAALGLVVLELGAVLALVKRMDISGMESELLILSALLVVLTGVMAACAALGTVAMSNIAGMAVAVAAIAALGLVVWELGGILGKIKALDIGGMESELLILSSLLAALTVVMAACAGIGMIMAATGLMGGVGMAIAIAGIAALGLVVWELGGVLGKIKALNIGGMESEVTMLTNLLFDLTKILAALTVLGLVGAASIAGVASMALLGLVVWELGGILGKIKAMELGGMESQVTMLTTLLYDLSNILGILSIIGIGAGFAIAGVTALVAMVGELGLLVLAVGAIMSIPGLDKFLNKGIDSLEKLAYGLGSMISKFGEGVTSSLPKIAENLSKFATGLEGFISTFDSVDDGVVDRAKKLAEAILVLTSGDFKRSLSDLININKKDGESSLEKLGNQLSGFATNASEFIAAMDGMKPETAASMESFGNAMKTLNDVCGNNNFTGDALTTFGTSMSGFADSIKDIAASLSKLTDADVANIKRASDAAMYLVDLNEAIPRSGGLWQDIAGEADLAIWGQKIVAFADSLVAYSAKVSGANIDKDAILRSAEAATAVSDLNEAIPKADGLWQDIAGSQDLAIWGQKLVAFAGSLVAYSNKISGANIDTEAIVKSADAAAAIAKVNDAIPESDGVWQWLKGEKSMGDFGTSLIPFAEGLLAYCNTAVQIDDAKIAAISKTGEAIDAIKKVMDKLPTEGGIGAVADWFTGKVDPNSFGQSILSLATGIGKYCEVAATIDQTDIDAIGFTKNAITAIKTVLESVPDLESTDKTALLSTAVTNLQTVCSTINAISTAGYDYSGVETLKTEIAKVLGLLGDISISDVYANFQTLNSAVTEVSSCASTLVGITGYTYGGIDTFKEALSNLAGADVDGVISTFSGKAESMKTAVTSFINAMTSGFSGATDDVSTAMSGLVDSAVDTASSKSDDFKTAGENLGLSLTTGISDKADDASTAGSTLSAKAASGASSSTSGMVSAGSNLGQGLVNGINSMKSTVYWAAYTLGQMAVQGEKDGQQSNSPSKATIQAGNWLGEGLIIGINRMGRSVYDAGRSMGDGAIGSISSSISKISSLVESGIDSQPTIRPVLDLSDIETGAGLLNRMLNMDSRVGVMANVGSISSMMSNRQNGASNDDVVSAINKLNKRMDNLGNTTYQINGVTYDDGSNITDAVRTIVRAAQIERRV